MSARIGAPAGGAAGSGDAELRHVLGPWLHATEGWHDAQQALKRLGIEDLQGLRRETNRRLVPEAALRSLLQAAHSEGRLAAAPPPVGSRGLSWPLPSDEGGLVALAERILELEGLKELLRALWRGERDQRLACQELLQQGVGSVSALRQQPPTERRQGLVQGTRLAALLKEAALREEEGEEQRLSRRCELSQLGREPFLATAPHNAFLRRDEQPLHSLEEFTSMLAHGLARELGGSALCWSREAQWRTELHYSLGHRQKAMGMSSTVAEALDPSNRDPNYLLPEELPGNAWFNKLHGWIAGQKGGPMLHVDVHGCQDPPKHPAHAMLGMAAMRQHAEGLPKGSTEAGLVLQQMEAFARKLEPAVGAALAPVLGLLPREVVTVTGLAPAVNERGEHVMTLSGAWPAEMVRLTQTQQSVSHAGASHAVQLELGRKLRHALIKDPPAVARLARAIYRAWQQIL